METKWKRGGGKKEIKQDVMDYVFIKDSHFEHIHSHQCDSCWSQSAKACPPAKIKVKKKNKKNKHAICFTHVVTLLTILFLWWLFFLFRACLFAVFFLSSTTAWRKSQAAVMCQCACHTKVAVAVAVGVDGGGWRWRWRWMGVDGGGWGPVTVTCNTALIGVTSPAEGGVVLH